MENTLLLALKISGIGIVVLLAVLAVFAGIFSLMTTFLKDKTEEEESSDEEDVEGIDEPELSSVEPELGRVAAIAVALARSQSVFTTAAQPSGSFLNSWGQFHLNRRLNSSMPTRRTR
ncbi:hypothetical protein EG834_02470 [bacterium]|nr:hypothetical protein [bacterium]